MKKLFIIILVLVSIAVQSAPVMPKHLRGTWITRLHCIGGDPWVYRTPPNVLLRAYTDRVEKMGEVLEIEKVVVDQDNELWKYTSFYFKNKPGMRMNIRQMTQTGSKAVIFFQDGEIIMIYYFNVFQGI
jgi:hypothetical protein